MRCHACTAGCSHKPLLPRLTPVKIMGCYQKPGGCKVYLLLLDVVKALRGDMGKSSVDADLLGHPVVSE